MGAYPSSDAPWRNPITGIADCEAIRRPRNFDLHNPTAIGRCFHRSRAGICSGGLSNSELAKRDHSYLLISFRCICIISSATHA
jgi:hypothetical protein